MMTKVVVTIEEDMTEGVIDIDVLSIMAMTMTMITMKTNMQTSMVIDEEETERVVIEERNEEKGVIMMTEDMTEDMTGIMTKDMIDIMADTMVMMMRGITGEMTVQQDTMIEVTMVPDQAMALMIDMIEEVQNSHHHREISDQS